MQPFSFATTAQLLCEPGAAGRLAQLCQQRGVRRVLIVTDPGIAKTPAVEHAAASLRECVMTVVIFDKVRENPTTTDVARCVASAQEGEVDLIIGLGGGSSMDTAKGANFILTNGGEMKDYWGVNKAAQPMLPMIAVPTTSGTGSECQSFALIADAETHAKMACGDIKAAARVAILDPELTLTMPTAVTAHTGIDAIAHALETAVCKKADEVSFAYSKAAWQLLDAGLQQVIAEPGDLEARARMQLGAAFAGTAIENSMLGIAHSCANPLTAHYGIVHGQAVVTMLPHVIDFNGRNETVAATYRSISSGDLTKRIREHLKVSSMDRSLTSLGVEANKLSQLAEEASKQWTAQFNPVEVNASALLSVYEGAL